MVVYVAIRYECPCQDPCYCTGEMRVKSQARGIVGEDDKRTSV